MTVTVWVDASDLFATQRSSTQTVATVLPTDPIAAEVMTETDYSAKADAPTLRRGCFLGSGSHSPSAASCAETLPGSMNLRRSGIEPSTGRRNDKFAALESISLSDSGWRDARTAWTAPLTPAADSAWDDFPAMNDLLPWTAPGAKPNRTWVHAPSESILDARWKRLTAERDVETKAKLLKASVSWLGYRKKEPGGRKSSPLDDIHVTSWDPDWTIELIDLLTVLRRLADLEPDQAELLQRILDGPLQTMGDLAGAGVKWPTGAKDRRVRLPVTKSSTEDPDQLTLG